MDLKNIVQQYRGTTLPKLIEKQIKSMDRDTLQAAIQGTYTNFPVEFRKQVEAYTLDYQKNWINDHIRTADLGDILSEAIQDIMQMSSEAGVSLNDDQVFDMFNLTVMRLAYFADCQPGFRKLLGIKKGWFS